MDKRNSDHQKKKKPNRNPGNKTQEDVIQYSNAQIQCLERKNNQKLNQIIQLYNNDVSPYIIYQTTIRPIVISCNNKIKINKECSQKEKDVMACFGEKIN